MNNQEQIELLRRQLVEVEQQLTTSREKLERQLWLADKIHRTLLPKPVRHKRINVDVRYIPIESVGGDYCQVRFPDSES